MSSSQRVFMIPELLMHIASFLASDRKSLLSAALLIHHWFECVAEVMWESPRPPWFNKVEKDRRQIYASKVKYLDLRSWREWGEEGEEEFHPALENLDFSKLKDVTLDQYCFDGYVEQYLQLPLRQITLVKAPLMPRFLDRIASRCPNLRHIYIEESILGTTDALTRFLRSFRSIESVDLFRYTVTGAVGRMTDPPTSTHPTEDAILLCLAGCGKLQNLSISKMGASYFDANVFERILKTVPTPFPAMKDLEIAIDINALPLLLKCLERAELEKLVIKFIGSVNGHLREFSTLTSLRKLSISFSAFSQPLAVDIFPLKSLALLESLALDDIQCPKFRTSTFSLSEFEHFVSHFPNLQKLNFSLKCDLSGRALKILSKHCPLLRECDLTYLEPQRLSPDVTFPHLTCLCLSTLGDEVERDDSHSHTAASRFAERIHKQCPKLSGFYCLENTNLAGLLMEEFHRLARESV